MSISAHIFCSLSLFMEHTPSDNFLDDIEALSSKLVVFHQNNIDESLDHLPNKVLWGIDTCIVVPDKKVAQLVMVRPSLEEAMKIVQLDYIDEELTSAEVEDTMYQINTKITIAVPGAILDGLRDLTPQWELGVRANGIPSIRGCPKTTTMLEDIRTLIV